MTSLFQEVVMDAESDGLFNHVTGGKPTQVYCVVFKDLVTKELIAFIPKEHIPPGKTRYKKIPLLPLEDLPGRLKKVTKAVGHNLITYDVELFKEVLDVEIPLKYIEDTLIMSQLSSPKREGGHSLESWGKRVGRSKPEHNDWSQFSFKMLDRCIEDTEINYLAYLQLKNSLSKFSDMSIRLEHKVRQLMYEQEKRGCPLDEAKAHSLMLTLRNRADELEREILRDFKPKRVLVKEIVPKFKTERTWTGNYVISPTSGRKVKEWKEEKVLSPVGLKHCTGEEIELGLREGIIRHYEMQEFNLGSPTQIVERMNEAGWKPYMLTPTGAPRVCEENLATLSEDAPQSAKNLVMWKICKSRATLFEAYLDNTDAKGRIHGSVNPLGTRTMRMSHSAPNLGNVPSKKALYGKEARECFTSGDPDKVVMVGADASGIQLRALAHYVGSKSYIDKVCGPDIHMEHGYILDFIRRGENDPEVRDEGRGNSKIFVYTWIFGGGDFKLGHSLGGGKGLGLEKRNLFVSGVEGLPEFLEQKKRAASRGYMKGLDGRFYKLPSDHLALPCYLQGFEQCVMKLAMVRYHSTLNEMKIPFEQVLMVHDEFEALTPVEYGDVVGGVMVKSIKEAGEILGSRCPLDGEYKLGKNWYEVH